MKFANIWYKSSNLNNLGEGIISYALSYIYEEMKIPQENIFWIESKEVSTYSGEDCVFPVVSFLQNIELIKNYSDKIRPIFICYVTNTRLTKEEVCILKKHEPIGCRDQYTLQQMQSNNIAAYLNGCITALLPRNEKDRNDQVVLSDIEEELLSYIPKNLLKNAKVVFHNQKITSLAEYQERALELLYLFQSSKLCITSRLHCASPAIAFGTPVVFVKNKMSSRFSWLDKYINLYAKCDYQNINWDPDNIFYEDEKNKILDFVKFRIENWHSCDIKNILDKSKFVNDFYLNRSQIYYPSYFDEMTNSILNKKDKKDSFSYAFWGFSLIHTSLYAWMCENYSNSKLSNIYEDFLINYQFNGLKALPISESRKSSKELIICFCSSQNSLDQMENKLLELEVDYLADVFLE